MDDIITTVPLDKVDHTLPIFNSFHERLQFTTEREVDHQIPYKLVHKTNVVRKKTQIVRASFLSSPPYKNQALEKAKRISKTSGDVKNKKLNKNFVF